MAASPQTRIRPTHQELMIEILRGNDSLKAKGAIAEMQRLHHIRSSETVYYTARRWLKENKSTTPPNGAIELPFFISQEVVPETAVTPPAPPNFVSEPLLQSIRLIKQACDGVGGFETVLRVAEVINQVGGVDNFVAVVGLIREIGDVRKPPVPADVNARL